MRTPGNAGAGGVHPPRLPWRLPSRGTVRPGQAAAFTDGRGPTGCGHVSGVVQAGPSCVGNHRARDRGRMALGILVLSLLALLGPVGVSVGADPLAAEGRDTVVIGFDDYPANISGTLAAPQITDRYADQGVVFPDGVTALRFTEESSPAAPDLPRSPEVVITTCYAKESCTNRIPLAFTADMEQVGVYVGSAAQLTAPGVLVMTAFDAQGTPLSRSEVTLPRGVLVPARYQLGLHDPAGRIRSAEITWATDGRNHDRLVLDDLTLTPFVAAPALTSKPGRLNLTLHDRVEHQTMTVTNTGNVVLTGLAALFRTDPVDVQPVADIQLSQPGCFAGLKPGDACTLTLTGNPRSTGTTNGAIEFTTVPRGSGDAPIKALLRVPVVVTVIPTTATSTQTTSENSTTSTTSAAATTPTTGEPTVVPTTPPSEATGEPIPWARPAAGILIAVLGALVFIGVPGLSRRLRRRGREVDERAVQHHVVGPSITIRSDAGRQAIDQRSGPVLTLVAFSPPPATITEEEP